VLPRTLELELRLLNPLLILIPHQLSTMLTFHHDLIFWEVLHSSAIEKELDGEEIVDVDIDSGEAFGQGESFSWDELLADDGDNDEMPVN